jgi:anti-sigma-K factor RskA
MSPDVHTLTGAYAADALPADERRFFEQHLLVCDQCAEEVAELTAAAARLGATAETPPPPDLKARVMAEVERTRQERPPSRGRAGSGPNWVTRLALPAAASLALLVIGVGIGVNRAAPDDTAERMLDVLAAPDAAFAQAFGPDGSAARLVMAPGHGQAVFVVLGMEPAPDAHVYELWLIHEDGQAPAGVFDVDEQGRAMHMLEADMDAVVAVGVTIEPEGGSDVPSGEPLMLISLAG